MLRRSFLQLLGLAPIAGATTKVAWGRDTIVETPIKSTVPVSSTNAGLMTPADLTKMESIPMIRAGNFHVASDKVAMRSLVGVEDGDCCLVHDNGDGGWARYARYKNEWVMTLESDSFQNMAEV